ncbi:hypothetical protein D6V10_21045, partial [Vibrio cholerae]|nr:hypothetical protein [Vibrio cholerae]
DGVTGDRPPPDADDGHDRELAPMDAVDQIAHAQVRDALRSLRRVNGSPRRGADALAAAAVDAVLSHRLTRRAPA